LPALSEIEPLLFIGLGIAIVGSAIGVFWYRATARSSFDRDAVFFIIKLF